MKKGLIIFFKILGFFVTFTLALSIAGILVKLIAKVTTNDYMLDVLKITLDTAAALLIVKLFIRKKSFRELGFKWRFDKRLYFYGGYGFLLGSGVLLIIFLLGGFTFDRFIWEKFFWEDIILALLIGFLHSVGTAVSDGVVITGYSYKLLSSKNKYIGIVLTSLVYVVLMSLSVSLNILNISGLFLFSTLLTLIYTLTGNLIYSMAFHTFWYFANMYVFSPQASKTYGLIMLNSTSSTVLSGGDSGIWGSLIFITAALISDIILIMKLKSREI